MNQMIEKAQTRLKELSPFIITLCVLLSAGWATEVFWDFFEYLTKENIMLHRLLKIVSVVFFFSMAYLLYRKRNVFFRPRTRYFSYDENPEKRKHLVLFLSNLPKKLEETNGIPKGLHLIYEIDKDIETIELLKQEPQHPILWKWEMPLRAIRHHMGILETVTLICSPESINQVYMFLHLCEKYNSFRQIRFYLLARKGDTNKLLQLSPDVTINGYQGFDFEEFDRLSHALWFLLSEFKKNKYKEEEIMIDITGGQKPTSVIGASMTFNLKIKLQYVQTNLPWHVVSYDVLLSSADSGELDS
ncbi:hypothetical protein KsCSTR_23080 [Candidatus Kuenenia stuttgartiensis]|jgi:hypothetical protein|uniref:Uncharacterized protein n=2 Tax=Candidatus Kuenenia TaxID=380738 RepID=Q1Q3I9_KUEST|nr:hypothetical protein [Candidatus Kuenenia stuttgartiensis]MBE7546929.1 hypothetical protein [Planctomycetia bacterium]MCF6151442.1 hypothetical protein [Candidatus Kuenenia stuttgartiensis]QII11687.1 hypothetical protein KsCSTR_23080 [Candidatus Kuenenia stuttgartiensis]CAJ74576.1 unknown protein* [Candidatus Kuenenia stuttgartiensis]